jgi:hypothetical protein
MDKLGIEKINKYHLIFLYRDSFILKRVSFLLLLLIFFSSASADYFTELENESSIDFFHNNGNSHQFFYPEIVGSGVALIDHDNDGDLDIYMLQSGEFKKNKQKDRFFKNTFIEKNKLEFIDVTQQYKLENSDYGIGIAKADINQDGWDDLLLMQLNHNRILLNQQGKYFETIHLESQNWSTAASFCDINNDGYLDVYISNYVDWSAKNNPKCFNASSQRNYCGPDSFSGQKDVFYLNVNKKLVDKTHIYFPKMPALPGLNVVCRDVNNDGWNDFIVANDGKANLLWLNQQGETFKESGLFSGLAVNAQGATEASMGMAVGDYDVDGDDDVFFTHLMSETNTLYQNNGAGLFQDVTNRSKLAKPGFSYTGWSTYFLMVNNDIYPDLVVFNGAVEDTKPDSDLENDLKQSNQLYINTNGKQYTTIVNEPWLQKKDVTRGVAFGDLDNDGDVDMVVNNNNGKAQILLNNLNPENWIGLQFDSKESTVFEIKLSNKTQTYKVNNNTDGSYASAQDSRVVINQAQLDAFEVISFYKHTKLIKRLMLSTIPKNKYNTITIE